MINLDEYSKKFHLLIKRYQIIDKKYVTLQNVMNIQKDELESLRINEAELKNKLANTLSTNYNNNLLAEHLALKTEYDNVKKENEYLKQLIDQLKAEHTIERDSYMQRQSDMLAQVKESYDNKMKESELRERNLTEALNISQNKSAMEFDLMQSNFTELLVESNKKLKALESANSILRFELQNSKNKKAINEINEAKMNAMKNELLKAENFRNQNINKAAPNDESDLNDFRDDYVISNSQESTEKYQTLKLTFSNTANKENEFKQRYYRNKSHLPPLVQVASSSFKQQTIKKRKLYNPNENVFDDKNLNV